ncbi:MAG: MarR family transcriptional regulator [Curtobacterium sp.]
MKQEIERRMQRESGLSTGDYAVMVALSEHQDRTLRSSGLADLIGWERSRLSHHLGRMERRGLIRRRTTPGDSRGAEILLTDAGADLFRKASAPHLRDVHDVFVTAITTEQLMAVERAMRAVRAHLDEHPSAG